MNQYELMRKLEDVLDDSNAGVLSTVDEEGRPHMRWMTPVLIKGRRGVIFTVTSFHDTKIKHITSNPNIAWMIQTRSLDRVINLKGKINILDNPAIKSEVLEFMGDKLTMFWRINGDLDSFVVLETLIEEAVYYEPMKAAKESVKFQLSAL